MNDFHASEIRRCSLPSAAPAMIIVLLLAVSCSSVPERASAFPREERYIAAVLDMENRTDIEDAEETFQHMTGLLIDDLLDYGCLRIVEREKLNAILDELKLGSSGLVDEAQAQRIGTLLGVDALLFTTLESMNVDEKTRSAVIAKNSRQKVDISITARLVHIGTGEILASAEASSHVVERSSSAFGFIKSGGLSPLEALVQEALNDAIPALADELASRIPRKTE